MIPAVTLLTYAALMTVAAPRLLARAAWPERAPRLGVLVWQALAVSVLAAATLAGLALLAPTVRLSTDLADVLAACVAALREQYATLPGAATSAAGAILSLALVSRTGLCVTRALVDVARAASRHEEGLALLSGSTGVTHVVVVDHPAPSVYCLAGRGGRIVVTTAARRLLTEEQLGSALAHERAHIAGRHHLVLAWAAGLARAFPRARLFTGADAATRRLLEMAADDAAARRSDRLTLAEALLALASTTTPVTALGAGGTTAAARVRRLIAPQRPLGRARTTLASAGAAVLLAAPVLALTGAAAADPYYCPPGTVVSSAALG